MQHKKFILCISAMILNTIIIKMIGFSSDLFTKKSDVSVCGILAKSSILRCLSLVYGFRFCAAFSHFQVHFVVRVGFLFPPNRFDLFPLRF